MRALSDDWIDLLKCLLDAEARFLVVGAHALAVHGVPRGTQDLDVWVDPVPANASRVWRALLEFGAPLSFTGINSFESAWNERVQSRVGEVVVPVIGREALVLNKRATARLKDLADIEALGRDIDPPTGPSSAG